MQTANKIIASTENVS